MRTAFMPPCMSAIRTGAPQVMLRSGSNCSGYGEVAVGDRQLEVAGHAARAGLEPHLAVVVLRDAPLPAVRAGRLAQHAGRRPLQADRVDRAVHPVVERPEQPALLVLDVHQPAHAGGEQLLLVGDVVVVGVGVLPDLVGVRLLRQDRVGAERHDEAREDQLVDEDVRASRRRRRCSCPRAPRCGRRDRARRSPSASCM